MPTHSLKRYRVGFDVGSRSLGIAAIEIDENGMPANILNAMSFLHDAGLDPDSNKTALTRKNVSGVARRTRRMYRARKKRLEALDRFLSSHDYPLEDLANTEDMECWQARASLTSAKLTDETEFKRAFSLALRHIARHRGWRNPYSTTRSMHSQQLEPSPSLLKIREEFALLCSTPLKADATLAEMVCQLPDARVKLRGEGGLFSERLHQKDLALELHKVARGQGLEPAFICKAIDKVFDAKSPKGSASDRVGKDDLDRSQPRAWRAAREFQEYRIIALLANVRVREKEDGSKGILRPLTLAERQKVFEFLNTFTEKIPPTWGEVASLLNIDRGDLKGTATSTDDGERVSSAPPVNDTERTMANSKIKEIRNYWKDANQASKDALIREFSNVELPEDDSPEAIAASTLLRNLPEGSLENLESIRLSDGRSAYSLKTLRKLTDYMLNNEADLTDARMAIFNVDKDWKPAAAPIGEPTGNPAVDRVLKQVNRWLNMAESRWGLPESINIETLRDGFKSERLAREIERDQNQRAKKNLTVVDAMRTKLNIEGRPRRSEALRFQSIQRQNGQCAYCGSPIDFKTAELDHIVPRAGVGSTNARYNLLATCGRCNRAKGKLPFAVWAKKTEILNVSLEGALQRVQQWTTDPGLNASNMKRFQQEVIFRLKRVSEDEEIDARSKEAVSWMAVELQHRLLGYYGRSKERGSSPVKIHVFRGEVTASARRAAGIEKSFRMIGGKAGKNRLDRRHHAIDAAVIAMMQGTVAQVLTERNSLRSQQHYSGKPDAEFGAWSEYTGRRVQDQVVYRSWVQKMKALVPLLQQAIDSDHIPVVENIRLKLGNGLAHEETVHPLTRVKLGDPIAPDAVDRASTPALWTALTREPDFDWKEGLQENPNRKIQVNGTQYTATDEIELFGVKAGAIKVRNGYSELGSAFHHARLYKIRGSKKVSYAMMRVYTVDLLRYRHQDLFTCELDPNTMSARQAEPKLRAAFRAGTAEYVTWFVVGDELKLNTPNIATGQVSTFLEEFGEVTHWRIRGLYSNSKLRLKPSQLASEGISETTSADSRKVIDSPGWLPAVNKVFGEGNPILIRRDAHGRPRLESESGLPISIVIG